MPLCHRAVPGASLQWGLGEGPPCHQLPEPLAQSAARTARPPAQSAHGDPQHERARVTTALLGWGVFTRLIKHRAGMWGLPEQGDARGTFLTAALLLKINSLRCWVD